MKDKKQVNFFLAMAILLSVFILMATLVIGVVRIMRVSSDSMYPGTTTGDIWLGVRHPSQYARGDIIAFSIPGENGYVFKRLIGLSGDHVEIDQEGQLYINGDAVAEEYVENQRKGKYQEYHVPEGCVFVLGDNRTGSIDSRYWKSPYLGMEHILAKAVWKVNLPAILAMVIALPVIRLLLRGAKQYGSQKQSTSCE